MAKYIALINWTEKGIKDVKASPQRAGKARALAKKLGGELEQFYMTMGGYDLVAIMDMPNDEAMANFVLKSAAGGHIRTTTLRAFDEATYRKVLRAL